jgi:hypothetical protein
MTFQVINTDNVYDNATLELFWPWTITSAVVGGVPYVIAGGADNGLSVFRVNAGGTLTTVCNINDNATVALSRPQALTTAVVGGLTYLFVPGGENAVSVSRIDPGGILVNTANVADDANLDLSFPVDVTTTTIGGTTYLFVAGESDGGVSVFRVGAGGTLTNTANVSVANVSTVTTATIGGATYLFAAGGYYFNGENIHVFLVNGDGTVAPVQSTLWGSPETATTVTVDGTTYLLVASGILQSVIAALGVYRVEPDGTLVQTDAVLDDAALKPASRGTSRRS